MDGTITVQEFFNEITMKMMDEETDAIGIALRIEDVKATYKIELIEVEEVNV